MKTSAKGLFAGSLLLNLWFFTQVLRPLQRLKARAAARRRRPNRI